jgi:hypothetical protein
MASEQAASIVDAEAVVIPTKSIPQGIRFGKIIARLHFDCSMTLTISSVEGFIVCPPLMICVAPIDLNISEIPSPILFLWVKVFQRYLSQWVPHISLVVDKR